MRRHNQSDEKNQISFAKPIAAAVLLGLLWLAFEIGVINFITEMIVGLLDPNA